MRRRRLLGGVAGLTGGLAGCLGRITPPPVSDASIENVTGADGSPSGICGREPRPGRIPAIVDPAFAPDWSDVGETPHGDATVVGL